MAFKEGCQKANPVILEPIMGVEVETPEDYMGDVMGDPQPPSRPDPRHGRRRRRQGACRARSAAGRNVPATRPRCARCARAARPTRWNSRSTRKLLRRVAAGLTKKLTLSSFSTHQVCQTLASVEVNRQWLRKKLIMAQAPCQRGDDWARGPRQDHHHGGLDQDQR